MTDQALRFIAQSIAARTVARIATRLGLGDEIAIVDIVEAVMREQEPPRCETCRHWEPYGHQEYGTCHRSIMNEQPDQSSMWARAEYGYEAELITEPTFGCILHEPKEEG